MFFIKTPVYILSPPPVMHLVSGFGFLFLWGCVVVMVGSWGLAPRSELGYSEGAGSQNQNQNQNQNQSPALILIYYLYS